MQYYEPTEWCDIQIDAADGTSLPRALMIGDSITRSYYPVAAQALAGKFSCAKVATSRCACHPHFSKQLNLVLDEYKFDVIHFNNGLHGWDYDDNDYLNGIASMLDMLTTRDEKNSVILAGSTPIWQANSENLLSKRNDRVIKRNQLLAALAKERNLKFNDLYSEVIEHFDHVSNDGIHFNPAGDELLGTVVAKTIRNCDQ